MRWWDFHTTFHKLCFMLHINLLIGIFLRNLKMCSSFTCFQLEYKYYPCKNTQKNVDGQGKCIYHRLHLFTHPPLRRTHSATQSLTLRTSRRLQSKELLIWKTIINWVLLLPLLTQSPPTSLYKKVPYRKMSQNTEEDSKQESDLKSLPERKVPPWVWKS